MDRYVTRDKRQREENKENDPQKANVKKAKTIDPDEGNTENEEKNTTQDSTQHPLELSEESVSSEDEEREDEENEKRDEEQIDEEMDNEPNPPIEKKATELDQNKGPSFSSQPEVAPAKIGGKSTTNSGDNKPISRKYTPLFPDSDEEELEKQRREREEAALRAEKERRNKELEAQKAKEKKGKEKEKEKEDDEVEINIEELRKNVQEIEGMWEESEEIRTAKLAMAIKKKQSRSLQAIPRVLLPSEAGIADDAERIHPVLVLSELPPTTIYSEVTAKAAEFGEIDEEMGFCDGEQGKAIIVFKSMREAMMARKNYPDGIKEPIATMQQKEISMDFPNICYINTPGMDYDAIVNLIPYPWKWISILKDKNSTLVNFFLRKDLSAFLLLTQKMPNGRSLIKKASFLNDKRGDELTLWMGNIPPNWFAKNLLEYLKTKRIIDPKVFIFRHPKTNKSKRCALVTFTNHKDLLRAYLSTWRVDGKVIDFQEPQEKEKKDESK